MDGAKHRTKGDLDLVNGAEQMETWNLMDESEHRKETWYLINGAEQEKTWDIINGTEQNILLAGNDSDGVGKNIQTLSILSSL